MTAAWSTSGPALAALPAPAAHRTWSPGRLSALAFLTLGAVLATYGPWADIARCAYADEESSHVFLVLPLVAWIVYVRQAELAKAKPAGSLSGPLLVALGWVASHYGFNHATQVAWHGGAVLVVLGCVVAVVGGDALFRVWPILGVLLFLIPVPGTVRHQIAEPLQNATARAAEWVLHVSGAPIARQGNSLTINGVPVMVAEACNGMRMAFPLVLIVYAFCFSLPLRAGIRVFLIVISPALAIGCNVLRVIPTVLMHGYASHDAAERFHSVSGWLMLPIAFLLLMGIVKILQRFGVSVMSTRSKTAVVPAKIMADGVAKNV